MNHTKCPKQAFWRHTVSAASAQTYSKDLKAFIVRMAMRQTEYDVSLL